MPDRTKNQHYVPQFLLRNFQVNDKNQIYVYDKTIRKSFLTNIRNIASENHLYDIGEDGEKVSFEPLFQELDGKASNIIAKIISENSIKNLDREDRIWLSIFISAQLIRTKSAFEINKKINDDIVEFLEEQNIDPNAIEGFKPFESQEEIKSSFIYNFKIIKEIIPSILSKYWILYTSNEMFWVSDNPVAMQNYLNHRTNRGNLGTNVDGIEIYLPISSSHVIGLFCQHSMEYLFKQFEENREKLDKLGMFDLRNFVVRVRRKIPIEMNSSNIENLNSLQVKFSERFVFSKHDDFELATEMINTSPLFAEGPRMIRTDK